MQRRTRLGIFGGSVAASLIVIGAVNTQGGEVTPPPPAVSAVPTPTAVEGVQQLIDRLVSAQPPQGLIRDPEQERTCESLLAQARQDGTTGVVNCHVRLIPAPSASAPAPTTPPYGARQPGSSRRGDSVDRMSDEVFHGSVYDAVGGAPFFVDLVDGFYAGVSADPLLRPLYPEDLTDARRHLAGFLVQYWGGPSTYSDERGHPRLRMRHAPFAIGDAERDAWLRHMLRSLDAVAAARGTPVDAVARIRAYLTDVAEFLVNAR